MKTSSTVLIIGALAAIGAIAYFELSKKSSGTSLISTSVSTVPETQSQFYQGYQQLTSGNYQNPTMVAVYGNPNTGIIVTSAKQGQTFTPSNTIPVSGGSTITQVAHTFNNLLLNKSIY